MIDFHKQTRHLSKAWANAWDLLRRKLYRVDRGRRTAVPSFTRFECGGISFCFRGCRPNMHDVRYVPGSLASFPCPQFTNPCFSGRQKQVQRGVRTGFLYFISHRRFVSCVRSVCNIRGFASLPELYVTDSQNPSLYKDRVG